MRFRSPAQINEQEWIAIALEENGNDYDAVMFYVVDNRLVPVVALYVRKADRRRMHKLPFESTKETLQTFLRKNRVPFVQIVRAGGGASE